MNPRHILGSWLLVALTSTSMLVAPAHGQPAGSLNPTHYWTYHLLQPWLQPQPAAVMDQFITHMTPIEVDSLDRLVNWVIKNGSAVQDTFVHYTWWSVQPKLPIAADVLVSNQFGTYPVHVGSLDFMLVPAWKNYASGGPPPVANHYLCYHATGFPPQTQFYSLIDEWRQDYQIPGPIEYLCVPCWKQHGTNFFPPVDTLTHLALYPIQPHSEVFQPFISDQFFSGPHPVAQIPTEYLLVPSFKTLNPTPVRRESWGELKTHYH